MRWGRDTRVAHNGRVQCHDPVRSQIWYGCLQISINFAERFGKLNVTLSDLFSFSYHITQLLWLNLCVTNWRILVQFSYHKISPNFLFVGKDAIKDTADALHFWLPSLGSIGPYALANRDVGLDPEWEWLLVNILTSQPLPVERACHGINLLLELTVVALHDLNSGASLRLVGHSLPLEALAF